MIFEDTQFDSYFLAIIKKIEEENDSQLEKWGVQNRHVFEWSAWTTEEYGEFIKELNELNYQRSFDYDKAIKEGIQTMTLLTKMIACLMHIQEAEN